MDPRDGAGPPRTGMRGPHASVYWLPSSSCQSNLVLLTGVPRHSGRTRRKAGWSGLKLRGRTIARPPSL